MSEITDILSSRNTVLGSWAQCQCLLIFLNSQVLGLFSAAHKTVLNSTSEFGDTRQVKFVPEIENGPDYCYFTAPQYYFPSN